MKSAFHIVLLDVEAPCHEPPSILTDFPGDGYSTLCFCCEAIDSGPLITRAVADKAEA